VLRFRVTNTEGKRVENTLPIGLVREFPKDKDAWREVDRIRLGVRINETPTPGRAFVIAMPQRWAWILNPTAHKHLSPLGSKVGILFLLLAVLLVLSGVGWFQRRL